jgi:hypothetical protein
MKRLLLLCMAVFISTTALRAQATPTVVADTVHYYFNKYYFRTNTTMTAFPVYKSAFATTTLVTHIGSKFLNNDTIDITGLEGFLSRNLSSTELVIPVHLYLCTLQNNLPVLPPIDSVIVSVTGAETFSAPIGGNFVSGLTRRLTTDFAVLLRNMSLKAGDTVRVARTAGITYTNGTAWQTPQLTLSDGFGYVRYNKQFYSTRDFTVGGGSAYPHNKNGFGIGTDYEFCIAPRVQYTLTADHVVDPKATAPLCTWEPMTVTSLASKRFLQRQYNLVEFARYWGNLHPQTLRDANNNDIFPSDSSVSWYFAPEDNLQNTPYPVFFLPYSTQNNQMTFYTDSSSYTELGEDSITCFYTNEFRTRYKTMAIYGRGTYLQYNDTFIICTSYCGNPYVIGLNKNSRLNGISVYPNPSTGKAVISGLPPNVTVRVYDVLGREVINESPRANRFELDLTQQPTGAYLVRIGDGTEVRTMRFIRQ